MNRRTFVKGLMALAGLPGIGARMVEPEPEPELPDVKVEVIGLDGLRTQIKGTVEHIAPGEGFYADAVIDVSDWMHAEFARAIAVEMDRAFLLGG